MGAFEVIKNFLIMVAILMLGLREILFFKKVGIKSNRADYGESLSKLVR